MITILFDKLISMNAFVLVPSISGIASKSFKHSTVNSGTCVSSSAADGLIKLCTADSTTATASIKIGDEQTLLIYKEPTERVYGDGTDIHFTKVTYLSGDFN